jgi:hypothetical protein
VSLFVVQRKKKYIYISLYTLTPPNVFETIE